jgi:hypothetical protein
MFGKETKKTKVLKRTCKIEGSMAYCKTAFEQLFKDFESDLNALGKDASVEFSFIDRSEHEINLIAFVSVPSENKEESK